MSDDSPEVKAKAIEDRAAVDRMMGIDPGRRGKPAPFNVPVLVTKGAGPLAEYRKRRRDPATVKAEAKERNRRNGM